MATRGKFSQEYKHEAVQLARSSDEPISEVARNLGITPNLPTRWCRVAKADGSIAFPGAGKPRDEEIANLRRELARVKQEREFLVEAAGFFAKVSK